VTPGEFSQARTVWILLSNYNTFLAYGGLTIFVF